MLTDNRWKNCLDACGVNDLEEEFAYLSTEENQTSTEDDGRFLLMRRPNDA